MEKTRPAHRHEGDCHKGWHIVELEPLTVAPCERHPEVSGPRDLARRRPGIRPAQRALILERDGGQCIACGRPGPLVIGHPLSVAEGRRQGASDGILFADENLAAMCDRCNAGFGERSVAPKLMFKVLVAALNRKVAA